MSLFIPPHPCVFLFLIFLLLTSVVTCRYLYFRRAIYSKGFVLCRLQCNFITSPLISQSLIPPIVSSPFPSLSSFLFNEALFFFINLFSLYLLLSSPLFSSLLFSSLLFSSLLFSSLLFSSLLFYSILFYSILFYSILFYSTLFYSILFYSILFCPILFCPILFYFYFAYYDLI